MQTPQQNRFFYRVAQGASKLIAKTVFRRRVLRNEIRDKQGPFVVIANHQAALDFTCLMDLTRTPMHFVISHSFYSTLPCKGILDRVGLIPKQQFQTAPRDMKRMKAVIDAGRPLVIYPAGLMCEDGLSTPIPAASYKFLQWIGADIYVARISGTYFVTPKWGKGVRPGRTYIDVYKLFSKEEVAQMDLAAVRKKTEEALLFDAYREQETFGAVYRGRDNVEGLERVLYMCPHCGAEFTVRVRDKHTLYCTHCGFEEIADRQGFLHNEKGCGEEIRYVSDWSRRIHTSVRERLHRGEETSLSTAAEIRMIRNSKFVPVGTGTVTLSADGFVIDGTLHGEPTCLAVPIKNFASLPFSPGNYFEIQQGDRIYRCVPQDGRIVMKYIHMVQSFYELAAEREETAGV